MRARQCRGIEEACVADRWDTATGRLQSQRADLWPVLAKAPRVSPGGSNYSNGPCTGQVAFAGAWSGLRPTILIRPDTVPVELNHSVTPMAARSGTIRLNIIGSSVVGSGRRHGDPTHKYFNQPNQPAFKCHD